MGNGLTYRTYVIHPGIGVARIGSRALAEDNGEDEAYFIGPEVPDENFVPPDGTYRDENNNIRRQAARFRIYEYTIHYSHFVQLQQACTLAGSALVPRCARSPRTRPTSSGASISQTPRPPTSLATR
jgi:hypothetical protein